MIEWISSRSMMPDTSKLCYGWAEGNDEVKIVKVSSLRYRAGCEPQNCWADMTGLSVRIEYWAYILCPDPPFHLLATPVQSEPARPEAKDCSEQ